MNENKFKKQWEVNKSEMIKVLHDKEYDAIIYIYIYFKEFNGYA